MQFAINAGRYGLNLRASEEIFLNYKITFDKLIGINLYWNQFLVTRNQFELNGNENGWNFKLIGTNFKLLCNDWGIICD